MSPEEGWIVVSRIATFLKYSFTAATTALSVISLRHETTYKGTDPDAIRQLTPVGRYYMAGVIALAAITISTSVIGDLANSRLEGIKKAKAQDELNKVLQGQLDKQLQQGIKPVLQTLGNDVAQQSKRVMEDLEQQAETSAERLRLAQDRLLAQTQQSSQKLTALNSGMEASAGLSRELLDRQQRLAEASSQVTNLAAVVTLPGSDTCTSKSPGRVCPESEPGSANVRSAIFHGLPNIQTKLIVGLQYGDLSVFDIPCSYVAADTSSGTAPAQTSPCLHATGKMDYRLGPNGGVALGFPFEVATTTKDLAPKDAASALRLTVEGTVFTKAQPPLRARETENDSFFLVLCVARDAPLAKATASEQEKALRQADRTLPSRLDVRMMEMLRPVENGSEYSAIHSYSYVRVIDRPSEISQGCLHPFYQVSF